MKLTKIESKKRIHNRIRKKISGTAERPRISVFRSNRYIYCQIIDDLSGQTIAAASSKETSVPNTGSKIEQAKAVGKLLADRAKGKNLSSLVFDRSGYLYHGRVKALADGARENGLNF
ncbi:MAG: 50S ribosomal protein L18 [Saprospiraceae bacterium]